MFFRYYYSKSRKISSWTLPAEANGGPESTSSDKFSWSPSSATTRSKVTIPGGKLVYLIIFNFLSSHSHSHPIICYSLLIASNDSRSSTPTSSRPNSRERGNYPQRAPSPTGSFTSTVSSQNQSSTRERSNSNSSVPMGGGWYEAIDPQSGRTYWFNRLVRYNIYKYTHIFLISNILISL